MTSKLSTQLGLFVTLVTLLWVPNVTSAQLGSKIPLEGDLEDVGRSEVSVDEAQRALDILRESGGEQ